MSKRKKVFLTVVSAVLASFIVIFVGLKKRREKTTYKVNDLAETIPVREQSFYEKYVKRGIDVVCASAALICFGWLYAIVAVLVKIKLGSPVLFTQDRPGLIDPETGRETIFKIYKFRTMTDEKDENGSLLPDSVRLTKFGAWLRKTSLDELPEVFNILNGSMSIVGPRPQLVRDMVFMTPEQRLRHTAKPGLSGLAQVNGRNGISWEEKFKWDLKYIKKVSLLGDAKIILESVISAFVKQEGITMEDMATSLDLGDYLLNVGAITQKEYDEKQMVAKIILNETDSMNGSAQNLEEDLISIIMPSFNASKYIRASIRSIQRQTYRNWELIIVDDCSSDNTVEVIQEFQDPRIRLYINEENSGAAISRNKALREAKGKWIAFLDSDDIWVPEKLEEQLTFMRKNDYAFTYTDYRIQLNGEWLPYINIGPDKVNKWKMYNYCYFSTITVMYDQSKVGLIQIADLKKNNDYAMWLQAVEKVDCYRYPKCMSYYIKHDGSVSSGSKIKLIKWHYLLFKEGMSKNPITATILTINNLFHGVIKKVKYKKYTSEIPQEIW